MVIGQAAEKVYRSLGPDCGIENDLRLEADVWLEYLPQETILFDQAPLVPPQPRLAGAGGAVSGRRHHRVRTQGRARKASSAACCMMAGRFCATTAS